MSTVIDGIIIQRIDFLQEQIRASNKPAVNKMFQLQIDMLRSADLSKLDKLIEWKKKEVKGCVDAHESERLFTELEALEWLERQIRRL
ncbi:MAG: hypothetical protein ABI361_14030 [Nitrososphaera sp.]